MLVGEGVKPLSWLAAATQLVASMPQFFLVRLVVGILRQIKFVQLSHGLPHGLLAPLEIWPLIYLHSEGHYGSWSQGVGLLQPLLGSGHNQVVELSTRQLHLELLLSVQVFYN